MRTQYENLKEENHVGHKGRWEDNIKRNPKIMVLEEVNLIHLAQNRVHLWDCVNTVMNRTVL
jgi:hypothetical protein